VCGAFQRPGGSAAGVERLVRRARAPRSAHEEGFSSAVGAFWLIAFLVAASAAPAQRITVSVGTATAEPRGLGDAVGALRIEQVTAAADMAMHAVRGEAIRRQPGSARMISATAPAATGRLMSGKH
jgi:hypothetical protein